jgi:hypothetical protein
MSPRTWRYTAFLAIPLTIALSLAPAGALRVPASPAPSKAGVIDGTLFGGTMPLVSEQGTLGRKLAIVRLYYNIGQPFSTGRSRSVMSAGSTVLASLDSPPRDGPSYASIIAGNYDKTILAWLTQAEQAAVTYGLPTVFVSFQHEANDSSHDRQGTPAQFVAAWDHIHALAAQAHLNWNTGGRLRWALILEHYAYFSPSQRPHWSLRLGLASNFWPGTANVDVVAADGYNRGGCRSHDLTNRPTQPAVTPGSLFDPVLTWARANGNLPVFLAEWASAYYSADPAFQADYITQMKSYVLANPQIAAVMYWDSHGNFSCQFSVNGHPESLTQLTAMGQALPGHLG